MMSLNYAEKGDYLVVYLEGDITVSNSMKLKDEIKELTENTSKHLLLDLDKVNYIDSTGLGALVALWVAQKKNQGKMGLVRVNRPKIVRLFKITQLQNFFKIYENETIAKEDLSIDG